MNTKEIGKRIATLRKKMNLSQKELAEKLNVSNKTVSKWETGNGLPDIEMFLSLSKVFNVSLEEIIGNEENNISAHQKKSFKREETFASPSTHTQTKKFSFPFIFLIPVFLVLLFFLFYWFPSPPEIKSSSVFQIDESNATLSCIVGKDVSTFSFDNTVSISRNSHFLIYSENDRYVWLPSEKVSLRIGDNNFYIVVKNAINQEKLYTVTIRRAPVYPVTLYIEDKKEFDTLFVEEGSLLNEKAINIPRKDGYTFIGWDYDFSSPINRPKDIFALWSPIVYSIDYDLNQGTWGTVLHSTTYSSDDCQKPLPRPSKNGYLFEGWKTPQGKFLDFFPTIAEASDLELTACWVKGSPELKISGNAIVDCDEHITAIEIPEKYRGNCVTKIGEYAFSNCRQLTEIKIPFQITQIDSFAFEGCVNVGTVSIPDTVKAIGEGAFSGCSKLTKISIPFVGASANERFSGKSAMLGYIFGTKYFSNSLSTEQLYSTSPASACETFYIPKGLNSVTVTGGNLLFGAFCNCTSLTTITLPDSLQRIPSYAFYNCASLSQINIPAECSSIGDYAFFNCQKIPFPALSNNIIEIGIHTFQNCQFTKINLPSSLNSIGAFAFSGCNRIAEILVPNSVNTIGIGAFSGCSSLESITLPFVGNKKSDFISTDKTLFGYIFGRTDFDGGIATVQTYGTYFNKSITYYIPLALKSIKITGGEILSGAFSNCETIALVEITSNIKEIKNYAFYNCKNIVFIHLPKNIKIIGNNVFEGCNQATIIYQ